MPSGGTRKGAGRPKGTKKQPTISYHRRILPKWAEILDKQIERLEQMQKEKIKSLKSFVKKIGDFLHSDGLRNAIKADWDKELDTLEALKQRMLKAYNAVEYKDVQEDIRLLWNNTAQLAQDLNVNCLEWEQLQEEAELIEVYF